MASSSPDSKRLTKPFSLATLLVMVSCCTHFALAAREVPAAGNDKAMRERYEKWMAEHGRTYKLQELGGEGSTVRDIQV
jgi:hypothetical protein